MAIDTAMRKLCLCILTLLCAACCKSEEEKFVDALMDKMTLREKLGQMSQFRAKSSAATGPDGKTIDIRTLIRNGEVGSILSIWDPAEIRTLQKLAVDSSRMGIPILFGHDIIHGCKTLFPINLGSACSWDPDATREAARIAAQETAAMGIAWTFSPMCDVSADPRWGRVSEGSGEDPYLTGKLSAAMVEGYQGNDLSDASTILACVKHFAAYGAPEAGREYNTVDMSERMFRDRYLPSYKAALDAGAASVMSSFNDFNAIPVSGNKWLLKDLLRDELGFGGFVVSDYNAVTEMVAHGVAANDKEAAALALEAGLDMEMVSGSYLNNGEELLREGRISRREIDRMCRNILRVKYRLGLFDDPFRYGGDSVRPEAFYKTEYLETARSLARESMVLLKNEGKALPLKAGAKIALIGPFAAHGRDMLGSWTAFGEKKRAVTIAQGLQERFPGKVTAVQGCKPFRPLEGGIAEAVWAARAADVAVLTLGLPGNLSGEAASLTSVELPDAQKELLKAVKAVGKPVVVLLVTGRAMALESVEDQMDALLVVWHPGTMGGAAVADLLSGDFAPSGHLAMSFPRCDGQIPIRYNYKNTGRPLNFEPDYTPTEKVKRHYYSMYAFTPNTPLYPFGYGLSYTDFVYDSLEVVNPDAAKDEDVRIRVRVSNVGETPGTTVAQLYLRDLVASTTRPLRELKGFERVFLKAGASRTVEFVLTPADRSFCREDLQFAQEPGDFAVWVGDSSDASLEGSFRILP